MVFVQLLVCALVGFAAGIALQRFLIILSVNKINPGICDCCQWKKEHEWRWEEKRRHK